MRELSQIFGESKCCACYADSQTSQKNWQTAYAKTKSACVTNNIDTGINWKYDKLSLVDAFLNNILDTRKTEVYLDQKDAYT